jgi:hypothetical protein
MLLSKVMFAEFGANLIAAKSTSITAAVVLACTFLPMSGGAIKPYELRELHTRVAALMRGERSNPALDRVRHLDWGDEIELASVGARAVELKPAAQVLEAEIDFAVAMGDDAAGLTPVIQILDEAVELCGEGCAVETLQAEEAEQMEMPAIEDNEDIVAPEMG